MQKTKYMAILLLACLAATPCLATRKLKLKDHPRLWVSKDTAANLKDKLHTPYLKAQSQRIIEDADWLLDAKPIAEGEAHTYQHGTRTIASHLQCLTAAWVLTQDAKYRAAAIRHLENLLTWNQVSCESRPGMPYEHQMFFCLSYGEHAADIGLMYDLFRPDITSEEQKVFFAVLDRFYLKEALRCEKKPTWWVNKDWSNWNGVCAGGMGIMALAFYNDRPECRKLIPFVEESLGEYFKSFTASGGGCHEGTGYWNYGMHYAMRYLLSWENATGKQHPAFESEGLRKSLDFPLDFTGISFGDNDSWHPSGMFFLLAKRFDQPTAALRAATYLSNHAYAPRESRNRLGRVNTGDILFAADCIPGTNTMATFRKAHQEKKDPVARVYDGLEWGVLADDSAFPSLRLSARGGSSEIRGHGHIDLLSFKCMINGQRMIESQRGGYGTVAFTGRGHHMYSRSADAKSTIFVAGIPPNVNTVCDKTEVVKGKDLLGIRINGASTFMPHWRRQFLGRLFLLVENRYWLIIDSAQGHTLESRFHTYANVTREENSAVLKRGNESMTMTFAAADRGRMQESRGTPANPSRQTRILRWMSRSGLHVTALNPGEANLGISIERAKTGFDITVTGTNSYTRTLNLTPRLEFPNQP